MPVQVATATEPALAAPSALAFASASAGPSTPWATRFFLASDFETPALDPSFPAGPSSRCSSEPPSHFPEMTVRAQRSRSVSRTPSLPPSGDSRTDLKSLPVTPKVTSPASDPLLPPDPLPLPPPLAAAPSAPCRPSLAASPLTPAQPPARSYSDYSSYKSHAAHYDSTPVTPSYDVLQSTQYGAYTDLFLLEPHEYDSITDGELVRLFDRGVIDARVLGQIVDASLRIQRACTDADRAVSIKTRRAMIRHALEE